MYVVNNMLLYFFFVNVIFKFFEIVMVLGVIFDELNNVILIVLCGIGDVFFL